MSLSWLVSNFFVAFLLPPLNGLLLVAAGLGLWGRRPLLGRVVAGSGLVVLWVLALPAVGDMMLRSLEGEALAPTSAGQSQAIVVLGNGRYREAPEYGGDTVSEKSLMRLRYAAKLQRESGLPLLVSGGKPDGGDLSEAEAMRRVLTDEFGVPVRWLESASTNTLENARFSAEILRTDGIERVLLVTHARHMLRASQYFSESGLAVFPAPTSFHREPLSLLDFIPSSYSDARNAIYEWIGLAWHRLLNLRK